jgi:hypothetical protein
MKYCDQKVTRRFGYTVAYTLAVWQERMAAMKLIREKAKAVKKEMKMSIGSASEIVEALNNKIAECMMDTGREPKWVIFDYWTLGEVKEVLFKESRTYHVEWRDNTSIQGLKVAVADGGCKDNKVFEVR